MRAMHPALLSLVLVTSCARPAADNDTLQRLAKIEQRQAAQDDAIAKALDRADSSELAALAAQIADLQAKLDQALAAKPSARPPRREPDPAVTYAVPIGASPVFGAPTAKVTLVMAMELDCPFCRRAWDTVDELRKRYGKDLRVVYKPYIVHPRTATLPAQALCAAHKQGKFHALADLIWTKAFAAKAVDPDAFSPEHITALAKQAKLDLARYQRDVTGACVDEVRDEQASMRKVGVSATPTFFINGRFLAGARPIGEFTALIDEEMAKAAAAIARGVAPAQLYEQEIVAKGRPELSPP